MWVIFLYAAALGSGPAQEPIATERPDFTETSTVVPRTSIQLETGFTRLTQDSFHVTSVPEALLRIGHTDRVEFRLGLPDYVWPESGPEGFDDLYVGAKFQLGPLSNGMEMALIPAVSIPVGKEGVRSESTSPELKICWSRELGEKALSGMVAVASVEESGERQTIGQHTKSLGFPIASRTGMFVEHVIDLAENAKPQHTLHSGIAYQPWPTRQWDLHFGFGLNSGAPDSFIGIGYSVRFDSRS